MIKERYLCFILCNLHENLANSPYCFPKCLCLRPRLSYSFNPVQKMQDQSWWNFVSSQLFPAPSLEFRELLVFIPRPWGSQIWHFSVNLRVWHELWTGACLLKTPLLRRVWLIFTMTPCGDKLLTGDCPMDINILVARDMIPMQSRIICPLYYPQKRGKRTENIKHLLEKTRPALYLIKIFCFVPFVIISIQWTNILAMKMTVPFHGQTK